MLSVCDHVYVLNFGQLLAEGKPSVIQTHPEVVAAYLGGEAPEALAQTHESTEDEALDAQLEQAVGTHVKSPLPPRKAPVRKAPAKKPAAKKAPAKHAAAKKKTGEEG